MQDGFEPPFEGFDDDAFALLRGIAAHQSREWFLAHKAAYEAEVRDPMAALAVALACELMARGLPFRGDARRSVFRVHRDVRFSKDKRPYKTHIGAALTRDGNKMSPGVLYIHVEPEGCFAAAGFYRPEPAKLGAIRSRIVDHAPAYRRALAAMARHGLVLAPDEDSLKRLPRGFDGATDADLVEALRRRSFIVRLPLSMADVADGGLVARLADFAAAARPLLEFGWAAVNGSSAATS